MKQRFSLFILVFLGLSTLAFSQNQSEETILTIDGKNVTKGEFERIYRKNNTSQNVVDPKSLEEYLELFINFKLKVAEAMRLGLDTAQSFVNELNGYRKQLAKPYLVDAEVDRKILEEAYAHLQEDIRASHILIKVDPAAPPTDTLAAFEKAMKVRERLLKGEVFETLAKEASDDPSAAQNGGDLGYFTGFQMVYPFEAAAFGMKVGEISQPVKTRFGYHLIKLIDRRPTRGQLKVAHIMVGTPRDASPEVAENAHKKALDLQIKVKAGEDFGKLARENSDDKGSAAKNGELPVFGSGRMVPAFEEAAFALRNPGDVSEPVQTPYGWHLIKLIERKPLASFDEMKAELKTKIAKDPRAGQSRSALVEKLKKEYAYTEVFKSLQEFFTLLPDSAVDGKWNGDGRDNLTKKLMTIGTQSYNQSDFANFILKFKNKSGIKSVKDYVEMQYRKFVEEMVIQFEETQLERKYPDFRFLMAEYHDGILLFDLTDKMVWTKAVKDSVGLEAFYSNNRDKYMWGDRLDAVMYSLKLQSTDSVKLPPEKIPALENKVLEKLRKLAPEQAKKNLTDEEVRKKMLKAAGKNVVMELNITREKYSKGDNDLVDKMEWKSGLSQTFTEKDRRIFFNVQAMLPPSHKSLKEARGLITADYQSFLEEAWIKELRAKYEVKVNKDVLWTIK